MEWYYYNTSLRVKKLFGIRTTNILKLAQINTISTAYRRKYPIDWQAQNLSVWNIKQIGHFNIDLALIEYKIKKIEKLNTKKYTYSIYNILYSGVLYMKNIYIHCKSRFKYKCKITPLYWTM